MATIRELLYNDGEALDFNDLNNAQRYMRAQILDGILSPLCRRSDDDYNGVSQLAGQSALFVLGNGAKPSITGASLVVTVAPGYVAQVGANAVTLGADAQMLQHYVGGSEDTLTYTSGAAHATLPRWDILQAKIDMLSGDSQTRDFKDATTLALSSVSFNKARRTRFTASIKAGTAGASPTEPSPDAGYVTLFSWRIEAAATVITAANFRDYRMPVGFRVIDVPGRLMVRPSGTSFAETSEGDLVGDGLATRTTYAIPQFGSPWRTGRVVAVGLAAQQIAGSGGAAVLQRANAGVYPRTYTTLATLTSTLLNTTFKFRGALLFDQAIWMDGTNAPYVQGSYDFQVSGVPTDHALLNKLVLTLTTGATHADVFSMARFVVAGM